MNKKFYLLAVLVCIVGGYMYQAHRLCSGPLFTKIEISASDDGSGFVCRFIGFTSPLQDKKNTPMHDANNLSAEEQVHSLSFSKPVNLRVDIKKDDIPFVKGTSPLTPVCTSDSCKVYIGDYMTGSIPREENRKPSYVSATVEKNVDYTNEASLRELFSQQKGYSKSTNGDVLENQLGTKKSKSGVDYTAVKYIYQGGESYQYVLVHTNPPILLSGYTILPETIAQTD